MSKDVIPQAAWAYFVISQVWASQGKMVMFALFVAMSILFFILAYLSETR